MTGKIKFLLGFIAVIALVTVFRVGNIFYDNLKGPSAANISGSTTEKSPINTLTTDSDHDGLPDRDEILHSTDPYKPDTDKDGYLDGEEVTTGHDPLDPDDNNKSRPGNFSTGKSPNLTDRAANLSVASLLDATGQINLTMDTPQIATNIAQDLQMQAALSLFVVPVKNSDIKISNDNTSEAIKKYLETVAPIVEENMMTSTNLSDMTFNEGPNNIADFYQKVHQRISLTEVPSSWVNIHKQALNLLSQVIIDAKSLSDEQISQDPIKAIFALNQFRDTVPLFHTLLLEAAQKAKSQNISTSDTIFELMKN